MFKKLIFCMAGLFCPAIFSVNVPASVSYIQETPQDIKEAIIDAQERVPSGTTLRTLAGLQQSTASIESEARVNQQIYDDIHELEEGMIELQQLVLDLGIKPQIITSLETKFNEYKNMLRNAGLRYNLSSYFQTTINQLNEWMAEVAAAPRTANFGVFKATLEVRLAEIVNLLLTKLTS